ncbi:MAG: sigma-70 family RNA polymerase sigma factor [Ruminococcus sp.]|nr:sigma-70 family RNA polymerase sigma factor [Ruminococcus sp.]
MKIVKLNNDKQRSKLEEVYLTYRSRMYAVAFKVLHEPCAAEDAVHSAFLAIARNIDKIDTIESVKTASYVIKAAKNTAINMAKKDSANEVIYLDTIDISSDEELLDRLCSQENLNDIVNAIMDLDEKYRDVLSLYYLNGMTVGEVAETLCRKLTTVKQQLVRGRQKLISNIKKEFFENEKQ